MLPGRCASGCSTTRGHWAFTRRSSTPGPATHWGNFPQAFTHLALINAVSHVISDDRSTGDRDRTGVLTEMVSSQTG